jgi:hypothetical protein
MTMTQNEEILEFMQEGKAITPVTALELFGCFRLAARINDLRAEGWEIHGEWVEREGRRRTVRYKKYFLSDHDIAHGGLFS